jgi:hypothetical protein
MSFRISNRMRSACAVSVIVLVAGATPAMAQSSYPSFQQPRVVSREFNFAIADGADITPLVFQWREGTAPGTQLSLDLGLADPDFEGADLFFMVGGQYARMLTQSRADMPLDILLTVGLFSLFGNDLTAFGVPVGVSVGHRFPLSGTSMAITPYVHPRVSLDHVSFGDADDTDINITFDLGGSLELTPQLALRVSAMLGGEGPLGDGDAIGFSLAWTPRGLRTTSSAPIPSR